MSIYLNTPFDLLRNLQRNNALHYRHNNTSQQTFYPLINGFKQGDDYILVAEVPGIDKNALNMEVKQNVLKIWGQKNLAPTTDSKSLKQERNSGEFERHIELPFDVDADNVSADLKDGLLTITLPLAAAQKPRQINIQ